ncbi:terminase small subunit [Pseudomonas fluorescens]|jgi:phage terminase small subunit|uniref:terminase small subunit n=1 Tax=Pseudomonas fluorescens TaxID=294 RepID=UPI0020C3ADF6|nr:terminase small subunit [Pseudomonas fluorescens]UTL92459.1 terminase small subunit [Pseudomonas fluorescens]
MALTSKKRRFVESKATGASNREAAEAAGYAAGSASAAGSRLAKDPDVVAALEKLKAPRNVNPEAEREASDLAPLDDEAGELADLPNTDDPLVWLLALMNEPKAKIFDRRNAAQSALPYFHGKKSGMGKKEQKLEDAAKVGASGNRFALRERHLKAVK